jgi:glycosyltransferase involved in cell wall biosynthesis
MRLLIVSQFFWPEDFRINDLVSELIARGHELSVLTGWPSYPDGHIFPEFARNPGAFRSFCGIDILRVPLIPRGNGRLRLAINFASYAITASLLGPWKLRGRRFDAVFVFMVTPATVGLPGVLLARLKRAPLACWVLDAWPEMLEAFNVVRSPALLRWVGKLMALVYNRCKLILAPSRSVIPQIALHCDDPARIVYFPNWAEPIFSGAADPAAPEVPVREGCFNVLFAGNMGEAQDFPAVLDAAEILKNDDRVRFLLVGGGRKVGWIREQIVLRGLAARVLLLGRYPVERMPSFFRHADAMLVCLKDEPIFRMTIPSKLQSYLAAGLPIVGMLTGECAELIERSGAGLTCRASDARGLAAAIRTLAAMPAAQREEMRRRALALSETEFDRNRLISRLESWLANLKGGALEGRPRKPRPWASGRHP